jgi:MoaA/NifB/PqqE/SkfB family radical SAM enzyme
MCRQARDLRRRRFNLIEISGTDPIEYPGIVDFVRYLKKDLGFLGVQLSTHGRPLRDAGLVKALKTAGLDVVKIPLYGSRAGIHDAVTQEKGSFRQTLQGLENVRRLAPKMLLKVASLIMRQNCRDVRDIYRVASRYAVWVSFSVPCISRFVAAERFAVSFAATRPQFLSLLEDHKKESRARLVISDVPFCVFGFYRPQIINPCGPLAMARTYRVPEVHRSQIAHLPSYRVKIKFPGCARCRLTDICGGFYQTYAALFKIRDVRPVREK